VSVDPDRDDPNKIRKFLDYFDKDIIGVTGKSNNDPSLQEVMKKFKIYSSKIEFDDP
jgi:protein SCO1/2